MWWGQITAIVLFVDDEHDIVDSVKDYFAAMKPEWTILPAYSAHEAFEILAKHDVRLVISDLRMPAMDGLVFLGMVRRNYPQAKRVLVTAFADGEVQARAEAASLDGFVRKPFDMEEMESIIARLTRR